ncbi:monofunctional biosynthetic peptidoglycan transglycosylase [Hyphomicrobium methylovorum]|uniref:monofunctional biosynthetic peptidoglycan transglycosylase n=1 Tax=Hyphomicrobium methylovorum TaxID=84 RepID=UPI001FEC8CCB|nr:monofunctional biosynthetic peptidoglycan transglycosylase [Hyphomicrobium methylovorum]
MPGPVDTPSPRTSPELTERPNTDENPRSASKSALLDAIADLAVAPALPEITAADVDALRIVLNGVVPPRPLRPEAFRIAPVAAPTPPPEAATELQSATASPPRIGTPPRPLLPRMFLQPKTQAETVLPPPPPPPVFAIFPPLPDRTFERPSVAATRQPVPPSLEPAPKQAPPLAPAPPVSLDPLFSEIDREASARAQTASEMAASFEATEPQSEPKPDPDPAPSLAFTPPPAPRPQVTLIPDLGREIPGMPRFEQPSSTPAPRLEALVVDPAARPARIDPPITDRTQENENAPRRSVFRRVLRVLALLIFGWLALVLTLIVVFRFVDPPGSSLMLQQWLGGQKITQRWVPIEVMSPNIVRAVVASEDNHFCQHFGIDFGALREAFEDVGTGRSRGASTISMQVTKNLFLWPSKSYVRKFIEFPLTVALEAVWPKRRILEVYLNIAEWGPGIFGIQAAAQHHFGKSAGTLTAGEASRLAAALPNPLARNPAQPGRGMQRLVRALQVRARMAPASQIACVQPLRRM